MREIFHQLLTHFTRLSPLHSSRRLLRAKTLTPLRRHPYPLLHPLIASRGRRRTKPGGTGEGGGGALDPLGAQHPDLEGGRLAGYRRSAAARRHLPGGSCVAEKVGGGRRWSRRGVAVAWVCPGPDLDPAGCGFCTRGGSLVASGAARSGGSVEVKLAAAGGEGCEGGAGSFMASGALACPCYQRQGLNLVPLGPEDGSRCTHCLLHSGLQMRKMNGTGGVASFRHL
jgi:hypothetical protein